MLQPTLPTYITTYITLSFYNNEPSKNKHFLILLSSLARNSQEPKLKRIFEIPWVLFEKSLSLYFDWPKSWIWRTLEKVMNIFCKWHFHNASKEVLWQKRKLIFMHGFKKAILAIFPFCQNGTFDPVPPLSPDQRQVERPPPLLQITSNFLVFHGLSHDITLEKKCVAQNLIYSKIWWTISCNCWVLSLVENLFLQKNPLQVYNLAYT